MAKLYGAILLTVLVALCSGENYDQETINNNNLEILNKIRDQVVLFINRTVNEIRYDVIKLNDLVNSTIAEVKEIAKESSTVITNEYNHLLDEVYKAYNASSILSKECQGALQAFREAYTELILKTNNCVDKRIQYGMENLHRINVRADNIVKNLTVLKDKAYKCTNNVHGTVEFVKALKCINEIGIKTTWLVTQNVPGLSWEGAKLGTNIALLPSQIGYCFSTEVINVIGEKYKNTMKKLNQCITNRPPVPDHTTGHY